MKKVIVGTLIFVSGIVVGSEGTKRLILKRLTSKEAIDDLKERLNKIFEEERMNQANEESNI